MEDKSLPPSPLETAAVLSGEALRELQRRTQAALSASREQAARLEADISQRLDELAATIDAQLAAEDKSAADVERETVEVARITADFEAQRDVWQTEREAWQAEREALQAEREELAAEVARRTEELGPIQSQAEEERKSLIAERDELRAEVARRIEELKSIQSESDNDRNALIAERDELRQHAEEVDVRQRASQDEWRNQLLDFESRLREQQGSWNEQRAEWTDARADLERERDELQHKFELALEDVQRLREHVAELEHDLARRPEANQTDSMELVALRAERDSLQQRVEELEQRPTTEVDPAAAQEVADLQRRFELAVEDVRELKTKNARLEAQLAAAATNSKTASPLDAGGMDWESQKRRLLATLEGGDADEVDAERKKERVTIAGTIEITDAVVAEKDRQILTLTAELEAVRATPVESTEAHDLRLNEILDADEVIATHRKRIQALEREAEEKLRATELEISVERAKLARQKVELEELRSNLEQQRQLYEATGVAPVAGAPRRRWLSKLGIDGKE